LTKIAQQLRRQTPMSRQWIAGRLRIGSASYVSNLLSSIDLLKLRFLRPLVRTGALPANQAQPVVHPQTGSLLYASS
jgi:hypothetical protein